MDCFAAIIVLLSIVLGAVRPVEPKANDSLADLLQWLTESIPKQTPARPGKVTLKFTSGGRDGCSVVLEEHFQATDEDSEHTSKISISLSDIDPDSIHLGDSNDFRIPGIYEPNADYVVLHTTNYVETITETDDKYPDGEKRGELAILINAGYNKQFAPKLQRAVELCHGNRTRSPLPDFVREFDIPRASSAPMEPEQPLAKTNLDRKYIRVMPRPHYRLCKEVNRVLTLEGGSYSQRTMSNSTLLYVVGTYPDQVFRQMSIGTARIKILEVPSEVANARCPSLEEGFPTVVERGPAYGWSSMYRYIEHSDNWFADGGGAGTNRSVNVDAEVGTDDVYCTHKFVFGSVVGVDTSYGLTSWTPTRMEMFITARSMAGGPGAHASITLFVRYLPKGEREKYGDRFGCTPMPPPQYAHGPFQGLHIKQLADGSFMYVVP
jgi:hypothetical protein